MGNPHFCSFFLISIMSARLLSFLTCSCLYCCDDDDDDDDDDDVDDGDDDDDDDNDLLGKPSFAKSAVFFNIVQKTVDPPGLGWSWLVLAFDCIQ